VSSKISLILRTLIFVVYTNWQTYRSAVVYVRADLHG